MKKFFIAFAFGLLSIAAQAEATFDQIEGLIQQKNYAAAEKGLEVIIQNHPQSAKAFYAMAQAQAGLGNLEKANKALNLATGLNPTLDFAPASSVASLRQAITPQTAKIEAVEESHAFRNFILFAMFAGFAAALYFLYSVYARKRDSDEGSGYAGTSSPSPTPPAGPSASTVSASSGYIPPATPRPSFTSSPAPVAPAPTYSAPAPAVVNNHYGSSNDGLLTGMVIGNMMSNHNHHDTVVVQPSTVYVERETVREVPAPSRSSTWDDTPAPSKSSSWDDTPSTPSRSSSWDDDSSSSSSSSSSSWSSSSSDSGSSWSDSSSSSSSSDW